MGARGNSGVITSQIFRGFSQGLEGKNEIDALELSDAFQKGVEIAYKAVVRPVEGTILTVVRESSQYLHDHVNASTSIEKAFDILIEEAHRSLKRTPDLLPILKEVGVVDSGGAGLIKIYEGMRESIKGNFVERSKATATEHDNPIVAAGASMEEEEFGYCTEFIMELGPDSVKKPFNEKKFTSTLSGYGNSLVVVRDESIVKVHVHTLKPGIVLNYAQQFGEFLKLKIENMTEQHHALATGGEVTATPDLVPEPTPAKPRSKCALIGVSSGSGIDEYLKEVGFQEIVKGGQTMNPSAEDFVSAIKEANADTVFLFPNNSNIVMAASQACEIIGEECNAFVIPSKTILQGVAAAINYNPECSDEENFREMKSALKNVKSGEITFAIRDSEINGIKVKKDDFIGIVEKEIVVDAKDKKEALFQMLDKMVDDYSSIITLIFGEDVSGEEQKEIANELQEKYVELDFDIRDGKQPVYLCDSPVGII